MLFLFANGQSILNDHQRANDYTRQCAARYIAAAGTLVSAKNGHGVTSAEFPHSCAVVFNGPEAGLRDIQGHLEELGVESGLDESDTVRRRIEDILESSN